MTRDVRPADVLARMRELDRRKLAAGKKAKAEQLAGTRKMWRDAKRRQTQRKQVERTQTNKRDDTPALTVSQKAKLYQELFGDGDGKQSNEVRAALELLANDKKAPASARVTALRTLAEMDGRIGKMQTAAADTTDQPLATMSRGQLEEELRRLRALGASRDA
jgi:hypothetical protein